MEETLYMYHKELTKLEWRDKIKNKPLTREILHALSRVCQSRSIEVKTFLEYECGIYNHRPIEDYTLANDNSFVTIEPSRMTYRGQPLF